MSLILGVLGGMGPAATLDFLAKLQAYTPAERDQDHIRVLMDLNPQVPDRNVPGAGAGPVLAEMAGGLAGGGAEVLAMPCNTAHAHADLIARASGLPLIDMIGGAAKAAADTGAHRVGVLGTKGALKLYREYLAARGLGLVTLGGERQEAFMALLYRIKGGDLSARIRAEMAGMAGELVAEGAETLIAGCTEAPLVLSPDDVQVPFLDAGDLLARRCVDICLELEPPPPI
ncbi:aspartate/glutamate racemase family protein [Phenylobacterium sp.]|uniref:aspartate/glutamate racemase family protein n=1 Tax=Phenylobacterium sp. TaxID=1871053 RepID=UPI002730CACF|nr:amino acid racemase [Phenylobacterium sp.]MDP1617368.1 amino acid racemase [Phenylobacterium sp.]MDP1987584.1 amino acid racemase [Phenylobacterium sp.]